MNTLKRFWDKRSAEYGTKIEGVLLKSVPLNINLFLHDWMFNQVSRRILNKEGFRVLDIGCGYGRLSEELLKKFPKIRIFGVDIAQKYVELYNERLSPRGKAVKADMRRLPFGKNTFDLVFVITTFMYLANFRDQLKAIKELYRVLKPGGSFIIVERSPLGFKIFNLGGLTSLIRGKVHSEIPAVSFAEGEISKLLTRGNLNLLSKEGIPLFTLFFYPILILSKIDFRLGNSLMAIISRIDSTTSIFTRISLYISYQGNRDER